MHDIVNKIAKRWESRAGWKRDYQQFGDEDSGDVGWEAGNDFFYPAPDDGLLCDYVPDKLVGDALEEALQDIETLIGLLRSVLGKKKTDAEFRVSVAPDGFVEDVCLEEDGYLLRFTDDPAQAKVFSGDEWEQFWKHEGGIVILDEGSKP